MTKFEYDEFGDRIRVQEGGDEDGADGARTGVRASLTGHLVAVLA